MATDKLEDVLSSIHGNPDVYLGAASSFIYIAPKDDMIGWLSQNYIQTQFRNRRDGTNHIPYLERKVLHIEGCDFLHGYIIKIEGDEKGMYSTKLDVTGERKPLEDFDMNGALNLITAILADIASDLTDLEVFQRMYCQGILSKEGEKILEGLERQAKRSMAFLHDEKALAKWTDISGKYVEKISMESAEKKIREAEKGIAKKTWDKQLELTWNKFERDKIIDMMTADASPEEIFKAVGRGKNSKGTVQMIADLKEDYETAMKAERSKYLERYKKNVPLKEQLKRKEMYANTI